jgi:hypothetical protein
MSIIVEARQTIANELQIARVCSICFELIQFINCSFQEALTAANELIFKYGGEVDRALEQREQQLTQTENADNSNEASQ